MFAHKPPCPVNPNPSNLRNPQGRIPASEIESQGEKNRQGRAKTPETHDVYENTGGYRMIRGIVRPEQNGKSLKISGLAKLFIAY